MLSINHPLSTLMLPILLRTFFSNLLEIFHQHLHLFLSGFFVALNIVNHLIDSTLSLFKFISFSFFHILLNSLCSLDSKIIFNHINILIDLCNLFVGVDKSERKVTCSIHLLSIDTLSLHHSFKNNVLSHYISYLSTNCRDS